MKVWEYFLSFLCPTYGTIKNMQKGAEITEEAGEQILNDLSGWFKSIIIIITIIVTIIIIDLLICDLTSLKYKVFKYFYRFNYKYYILFGFSIQYLVLP